MAVKAAIQPTTDAASVRPWPPLQGEWTYDDYARLPDHGMRYEVITGELYMTPAPVPKHQKIIANLYGHLWEYLRERLIGDAFFAPIDVNLPGLASPVQPDLLFIASDRLHIVKERFIEGVPDLIVEVLSSGSEMHDRRTKFELYARAGVSEYWLVDPDERSIEIYVLRGQAYAPLGNFGAEEQTRSEVMPDFALIVGEICPA